MHLVGEYGKGYYLQTPIPINSSNSSGFIKIHTLKLHGQVYGAWVQFISWFVSQVYTVYYIFWYFMLTQIKQSRPQQLCVNIFSHLTPWALLATGLLTLSRIDYAITENRLIVYFKTIKFGLSIYLLDIQVKSAEVKIKIRFKIKLLRKQ